MARGERPAVDLQALQRHQDEAFGTGSRPVEGARAAERFLARVGVALRYGPTKGLPLASLYRALGGVGTDRASLARCIALTNQLLGEGAGIEVHVVADRVTVVHRSLVPALYALVRRGRAVDDLDGLSGPARLALALLHQKKQVTAGDVRERLGVRFDPRRDPAYGALGELARLMLVDRGPFEVPRRGIPYLSTEGYPHHLFHEVHADLAAAARGLTLASAAEILLDGYLKGAAFARVGRLAGLFKHLLSLEEVDRALRQLAAAGRLRLVGSGRDRIAVRSPASSIHPKESV
ncbi:MAG TPA: hypothetical protein VMT70_00685 [Vicinamibacteria bacterium]|nr:hypothetical protein [Vicinamibacteria bacterium]